MPGAAITSCVDDDYNDDDSNVDEVVDYHHH